MRALHASACAGVLAACVLAACSVPPVSLEGKQCPCVESGYVCDTQTNRCLATNDGGRIIDSPAATQCLGAANETEIYRYTGTFDWQHADPSWMGGTEIMQSSSSVQNSYAFKVSSELTAAPDVHVISSMRQIELGSGMPAFGITLRAQLSLQTKDRYMCMWSPKQRVLQLQAGQGGNVSTLRAISVPASPVPPTTFTMEASITGSTLACCIREIEGARLTGVMDGVVMAGYPGVETTRMQAAFGSFVVLKPN